MVVIRLARGGSKKNPFYHIVVADKRKPRDGRFIEQLGYFNPMARGHDLRLQLSKERVDYWIAQGAQASDRVHSLLRQFEKSPETAQHGGISRIDAKKAQSEKAQQAQELAAKKAAEEAAKVAKEAEATAPEEKSEDS